MISYNKKSFLKSIYPKHGQRWPLFIWLGLILIAIFLHLKGTRYKSLTGTVKTSMTTISPMETAKIKSIYVQMGDKVKKGDILVQLDASQIDTEIAVLEEKILTDSFSFQLDELTLKRQFASALQKAEENLRKARLDFEKDQAELLVLNEEMERMESLLQKQLIDAGALAAIKTRRAVISKSVELAPKQIASLENDVREAKAQKQAMESQLQTATSGHHKVLLSDYSSALESSKSALELLRKKRDSYTIRAQCDGIVSEIYEEAGAIVKAATPILSIINQTETTVIGFLPEAYSRNINVDMMAYVSSEASNDRSKKQAAKVIAVSPNISDLPTQASPLPGPVLRGRKVILKVLENSSLIPGESVSIDIIDEPSA